MELTTDEHGWTRKRGRWVNDNGDNVAPKSIPLGRYTGISWDSLDICRRQGDILPPTEDTDEHGWTRKRSAYEFVAEFFQSTVAQLTDADFRDSH